MVERSIAKRTLTLLLHHSVNCRVNGGTINILVEICWINLENLEQSYSRTRTGIAIIVFGPFVLAATRYLWVTKRQAILRGNLTILRAVRPAGHRKSCQNFVSYPWVSDGVAPVSQPMLKKQLITERNFIYRTWNDALKQKITKSKVKRNKKFTSLQVKWKKRSERRKTLRAGCSKAEPKFFAPPQTPFPGAHGQNLISWRWSLPLPTNPVWWGSMHAISGYRSNKITNTPTNTQTYPQIGPITMLCAAASLARSVKITSV